MSGECRYLIELHAVRRVILMFHGPSLSGRIETACADYRRKLPWASIIKLREQQERDADELLDRRAEWACDAGIHVYRAEVDAAGSVTFVNLDPDSKHGSERVIQREGS